MKLVKFAKNFLHFELFYISFPGDDKCLVRTDYILHINVNYVHTKLKQALNNEPLILRTLIGNLESY